MRSTSLEVEELNKTGRVDLGSEETLKNAFNLHFLFNNWDPERVCVY